MLSKNNTNTVLSGLIRSSERLKDYDSNPDNGKINIIIFHTNKTIKL